MMYATPAGRDVHDVIRDIAAAMPDGWVVGDMPHGHGGSIVGPDGVRVFVRIGTYGAERSRLMFSASTPDGVSYSDGDTHGLACPTMTAGADRDPAAIARDVVRKLAGPAAEYYAAVSGRIARRVARANGAETAARQLADRMGTRAREWRGEWQADMPADMLGEMAAAAYGETGDDIRVTVRMPGIPLARALELADMIRAWEETR